MIDEAFAALIPPLTHEEEQALSASIQAEGVRDALVVWESENGPILLDGHNRLRLAERHGKPYRIAVAPSIQTREEAMLWMLKNQLSRRNLTPEQASQLRGQRYNLEKRKPWRPEKGAKSAPLVPTSDTAGAQQERTIKTAERLAGEYKVAPRTIKNDGEFAAAVDTLAATAGPAVRKEILSGDSPLPKGDIIALAKAAPEEQSRVLAITDKKAILAAAKQIKEQQATARREARTSDLSDEERKARETERRWREDGEVGRIIDRLYKMTHSTTADHAAEVLIEFGLADMFIQLTADMVEESAAWLHDYGRHLRQHLGTQAPLRRVE